MSEPKPWSPPFPSIAVEDLECPTCGGGVMVQEKETYFNGEHDAYCIDCHEILEVQSTVRVEFSNPQPVFISSGGGG